MFGVPNSLKETYIKARGMGLAVPLHKFGLHYSTVTRSRSPSIQIWATMQHAG